MSEKHNVWSDVNLDFKDWKPGLENQYPDKTEDELISIMYETNIDYLLDERINLNIQLPREVIIIADIGRWNGRVSGYKIIESGNIKDCLYSECDMNEWFVDEKGDFRCDAYHHDGTNHYLYRTFKCNAIDEQIDRLKDKIYNGTVKRADIERVTDRLGDEIGKIYGWEFQKAKQKVLER
jgi:hypothetical protein